MCTCSEANDLAIRVAKAYSRGNGIIATTEAYHGTSELTSGVSPALGTGQTLSRPLPALVAPNAYISGAGAGPDGAEPGTWFANRICAALADMEANGIWQTRASPWAKSPGAGLFIGLKLAKDPSTREQGRGLALALLEQLRERGVLTPVAGPHGNIPAESRQQ